MNAIEGQLAWLFVLLAGALGFLDARAASACLLVAGLVGLLGV